MIGESTVSESDKRQSKRLEDGKYYGKPGAWSSGWRGWNGTLVVITHVWCQVDRTGEMELEIDGEERTHHFELWTNRRLCCARLRGLGEAARGRAGQKSGVDSERVVKGKLTSGVIVRLHTSYHHPTQLISQQA